MTHPIVIAGTDTGIGKTVFSAALSGALDACYWKPIQAGLDAETDSDAVRRLSGLPPDRILPEAYRLRTPASPHLAAERDGVTIDVGRLASPSPRLRGEGRGAGQPQMLRPGVAPDPDPHTVTDGGRELVIELAGGLLVPLTRSTLQIDLVARWAAPVVLCASTRLGTINHTLLSLEALKARAIPTLGVAFIGDPAPDTEAIISGLSGVRRLGRLPRLDPLDAATLRAAFLAAFQLEDFKA